MEKQRCPKCGEEKSKKDFYASLWGKRGSPCKRCDAAKCRKYREGNKKKIVAYNKRYRKKNKEKIAVKMKKYREENKERIVVWEKKYRKENKEVIAMKKKKYNKKNKVKIATWGKKYRKKNKGVIAMKKKKYCEEIRKKNNNKNPYTDKTLKRCPKCKEELERKEFSAEFSSLDGLRTYCKRCDNARRYTHSGKRLTKRGVKKMYKLQKGCCAICGEGLGSNFHIDHSHTDKDFRGLLCKDCNFGLGFFKDNPQSLQRALNYLKKPPSTNISL